MNPTTSQNTSSYLLVRSVTDRVAAGALLVAVSPLMVGIAAAVAIRMGRPVLFRQERVGLGGRRFAILKFRTMVEGAEELGGGYMPAELDLIPPLGRALRSSSLDELPQLLNIARGEMAFVGPRPALPSQYERYTERQRGRVSVPQGVTGLAQVRHRNAAPWSTRIEADLEYVQDVSFARDLGILAATVRNVLRRSGVELHQTAQEVDDLAAPSRDTPDRAREEHSDAG